MEENIKDLGLEKIFKEEDKSKKSKSDKWNGNTDYPSVDVYKNHIYYCINVFLVTVYPFLIYALFIVSPI